MDQRVGNGQGTLVMTAHTPALARRAVRKNLPGLAVASPGILLLAVFSIVPLVILIVQGFISSQGALSLDAFHSVVTNVQYTTLLLRSLGTALIVTVISVGISWPVAWVIARHVRPESRNLLLALIIIPFLTSQILLIYAMLVLLGAGGPLMTLLSSIGVASAQSSIVYTPWATVVMFVYESISVIVLVLYAASERIDGRLIAASRSLGAGRVRTFMNVVWPASSTSLIAATSITFVATAGAFAEPAILGGPHGTLIGNVIADRMTGGASGNVTAALALVLLVASLVCVALIALVISRLARPLRPSHRTRGASA